MTTTLQLGFGVCLVIQRDPIVLAKEVASIDHLSGGRVLFGVGGGWNLEEMANHGTDPKKRWPLLRERVLAMKEIWSKDEAEFHGEFVDFDPIWSWPKPVRMPPVLLGGDGPKTFDRVLEYGDGWMPINRGDIDRLAARDRRIAGHWRPTAACRRCRSPSSAACRSPRSIERYAELGVERVLFCCRPPAPTRSCRSSTNWPVVVDRFRRRAAVSARMRRGSRAPVRSNL